MNFNAIRPDLTAHERAGDFEIWYVPRNRPQGRGFGATGIRSSDILAAYRETFEWLHSKMRSLEFQMPQTQFRAFLFELSEASMKNPNLFWDGETWSCALPSRSDATTSEGELRYFRAVAAHEGTHRYCFDQAGFASGQADLPDKWAWVAEGTAVWMEMNLLNASQLQSLDSLEFCRDWCDYPEDPMVTLGRYQSGVFFRYLTRRWGDSLIGKIWTTFTRADDPWRVMRMVTGASDLLLDYAVAAYFVGDPRSHCYSQDIADRFHSRALTESVTLGPGQAHTIPGSVDDGGTRYYALRLSDRDGLELSLQTSGICAACAAAVDGQLRQTGNAIPLHGRPERVVPPPDTEYVVVAVTAEPAEWRTAPERHQFQLLIR